MLVMAGERRPGVPAGRRRGHRRGAAGRRWAELAVFDARRPRRLARPAGGGDGAVAGVHLRQGMTAAAERF
ncbi:MAG: hypothetical protein MZW92_65125 [Comamonadaceae bacterium]|nr:hypothetical protein [Comamonadaceae bacterium]